MGFITLSQAQEAAAVLENQRNSITRWSIDVGQVAYQYQEPIQMAIIAALEQARFDKNSIESSQVTEERLSEMVRAYLDAVKVDRARAQAEYDERFKDEIITAEMLRGIVDSAFIYKARVHRFQLSQTVFGAFQIGNNTDFSWKAEVEVEVDFWRVNFDTGALERMDSVYAHASGIASETLRSRQDARFAATERAADMLIRDIRSKVRNIPEFSLGGNVVRATPNSVYFRGGELDGIAVDSYYKVSELASDGTVIPRGWVKVRDVAKGDETESRAQIIAVKNGWSLEGGERLEEYSQKGLEFAPVAGMQFLTARGGTTLGSKYDVDWAVDLGLGSFLSLAEKTKVSEFFIGGYFHALIAGPHIGLFAEVGIAKRFYVRRFLATIELLAGYGRLLVGHATGLEQGNVFGAHPTLVLGVWSGPKVQVAVRAGYRYYIKADQLRDSDSQVVFRPGYEYNPSGLSAQLEFRITK